MRYLTIRKFSSESGYTEAAIRSKIADGTWMENRVWRRAPDKRILIDVQGYVEWVESESGPQRLTQKAPRKLPENRKHVVLSPPPLV